MPWAVVLNCSPKGGYPLDCFTGPLYKGFCAAAEDQVPIKKVLAQNFIGCHEHSRVCSLKTNYFHKNDSTKA